MRFKQNTDGYWVEDIAPDFSDANAQNIPSFDEVIIAELAVFAAEHEIDVSRCEVRRDFYEAFIASGVDLQNSAVIAETDFESMTVPQLKQYAAEHEISIGGATLKPDILALLQGQPNRGGN